MPLSEKRMLKSTLNRGNRFFRSVFTKLVFINITAWFLIFLSVNFIFLFLFSKRYNEGPLYAGVGQYLEYLINDIGSPPEQWKARVLHEQNGVHISYSGKGEQWTTGKRFPEIEDMRFRPLHGSRRVQIGRKFGRRLLMARIEEGVLYFDFAGVKKEDVQYSMVHMLLLFLLSMILFGTYRAVKKVLRPLEWLDAGVTKAAAGNLNYQVPVRGSDELAELALSFNKMTARLKEMITAREHLLRDISHELRSPLTRMKVSLELFENTEVKAEIKQDIIEMEEMITGILDSARKQHDLRKRKQKIEKCNLDLLLASVVKKYANQAPGILYITPKKPIFCTGDERTLQTVFSNLVDNGIKFSAHGNRAVEVKLVKNNRDQALITVKDFGQGMDEAELIYIFEPFYRVDKSRSRKTGGFGLGLSLCKTIIQAHNGMIKVQSKPGQGTCFSIILPAM